MAWFSRRAGSAPSSATRALTRRSEPRVVVWVEVLENRMLLSAAPMARVPAHAVPAPHAAVTLPARPVKLAPVSSGPAAATVMHAPSPRRIINAPLATLTLKPLDLNLLGVEVKTSPITIKLSTKSGRGQLLGNLLQTASTLVDLRQASTALNRVLGSVVDVLNATNLSVGGVGSGADLGDGGNDECRASARSRRCTSTCWG